MLNTHLLNTQPLSTSLRLARGQLAHLGSLHGARLECRRGTLWITLDNDPRDIVLDAGESFSVDSHGNALVNALGGPAELALREAVVGVL